MRTLIVQMKRDRRASPHTCSSPSREFALPRQGSYRCVIRQQQMTRRPVPPRRSRARERGGRRRRTVPGARSSQQCASSRLVHCDPGRRRRRSRSRTSSQASSCHGWGCVAGDCSPPSTPRRMGAKPPPSDQPRSSMYPGRIGGLLRGCHVVWPPLARDWMPADRMEPITAEGCLGRTSRLRTNSAPTLDTFNDESPRAGADRDRGRC